VLQINSRFLHPIANDIVRGMRRDKRAVMFYRGVALLLLRAREFCL
jgi:hypothetical protein